MPLAPEAELQLVRELKDGHTKGDPCFETLLREYRPPLAGFVRSRIRHPSDADEILNEVWLKFWRGLPNFKPGYSGAGRSALLTYLYTIAENAMIDYYRRTGRIRQTQILIEDYRQLAARSRVDPVDLPEPPFAASGASPEEALAEWETMEQVLRVVFGMTGRPPHEVLVFAFTTLLGHTPRALASDEFSSRPLGEILARLENELAESTAIPGEHLNKFLGPLRDSLKSPAGGQQLEHYYTPGSSRTEDIRIWRHNVLRRVVVFARRRLGVRT